MNSLRLIVAVCLAFQLQSLAGVNLVPRNTTGRAAKAAGRQAKANASNGAQADTSASNSDSPAAHGGGGYDGASAYESRTGAPDAQPVAVCQIVSRNPGMEIQLGGACGFTTSNRDLSLYATRIERALEKVWLYGNNNCSDKREPDADAVKKQFKKHVTDVLQKLCLEEAMKDSTGRTEELTEDQKRALFQTITANVDGLINFDGNRERRANFDASCQTNTVTPVRP